MLHTRLYESKPATLPIVRAPPLRALLGRPSPAPHQTFIRESYRHVLGPAFTQSITTLLWPGGPSHSHLSATRSVPDTRVPGFAGCGAQIGGTRGAIPHVFEPRLTYQHTRTTRNTREALVTARPARVCVCRLSCVSSRRAVRTPDQMQVHYCMSISLSTWGKVPGTQKYLAANRGLNLDNR